MPKHKRMPYSAPDIIISNFDSNDVIATSGSLGGDVWDNGSYVDPSGWT